MSELFLTYRVTEADFFASFQAPHEKKLFNLSGRNALPLTLHLHSACCRSSYRLRDRSFRCISCGEAAVGKLLDVQWRPQSPLKPDDLMVSWLDQYWSPLSVELHGATLITWARELSKLADGYFIPIQGEGAKPWSAHIALAAERAGLAYATVEA